LNTTDEEDFLLEDSNETGRLYFMREHSVPSTPEIDSSREKSHFSISRNSHLGKTPSPGYGSLANYRWVIHKQISSRSDQLNGALGRNDETSRWSFLSSTPISRTIAKSFIFLLHGLSFPIYCCLPLNWSRTQYTSEVRKIIEDSGIDFSESEDISTIVNPSSQAYDGNIHYSITVLGAPYVGKSEFCLRLKNMKNERFSSIPSSQNSLRFSAMPPDVRLTIKESFNSTKSSTSSVPPLGSKHYVFSKEKCLVLDFFDSIGISDIELLKYLLEGYKKKEEDHGENILDSDDESAPSEKLRKQSIENGKKRKKSVNDKRHESFLVLFDVSNWKSFEMACALVHEIFEFFLPDPKIKFSQPLDTNSIPQELVSKGGVMAPLKDDINTKQHTGKSPVLVYLLANKIDSEKREVSEHHIRLFVQRQQGFLKAFEISALNGTGIESMLLQLVLDLQENSILL